MQDRDLSAGAHIKKAEGGKALSCLQGCWKPLALCLLWEKAGQERTCWGASVEPALLPTASVLDWSWEAFIFHFKKLSLKAPVILCYFTLCGLKIIFGRAWNHFTHSQECGKHGGTLSGLQQCCVYCQWRPLATFRETISVKWSIKCCHLINEAGLFIVTGTWPGSLF